MSWRQNKHTCQEGTEITESFEPRLLSRERKWYPDKRRHICWKLSQELKGKIILATFFAQYKHIKMKPRIYVLFVFYLDGECKSLKTKHLFIKEIGSWLSPFCKQNLLFIPPRWQPRTYFLNNYSSHHWWHFSEQRWEWSGGCVALS